MIFLIFWLILAHCWGLSLADVSVDTRFLLLTISLLETFIEIMILGYYIFAGYEIKQELKKQERWKNLKDAHV